MPRDPWKDAARNIERVLRAGAGRANDSTAAIGERITNRTKELAPVESGRLRDSYTHVEGTDDDGTRWTEIQGGGEETWYAGLVEFGSSRGRARPHLRPAVEEALAEIPGLVAEGVRRRQRGGV